MSDDEAKLKVAGRAPADIVGGMRIPEKKKSPHSVPGKDVLEVIGLSQNNPLDTAVQMSTSPSQKTITLESTQGAHGFKPAQANLHQKPMNHTIQQPRK